jgi:4-amino-4-deoxy-L-arabinose transferase-like glycosyltransferase
LGHVDTLDMGLSAMMTITLCGLLLAQRDGATATEQRNWMLVCWGGMALAVLSKGLIGIVLPGAVLVVYSLMSRDWALWKRLHFGKGLLLFFAVSAPWFVLVSLRNPEFLRFFFIHEHFQRFISKVHHREGPWYYFIPILLLGITPWLALLPQALALPFKEKRGGFQPAKMLFAWCAFIFFFFSISGSKLPSYILPIFPALALLVALQLKSASKRAIVISAVLLAVAGAVGLAFFGKVPGMASNSFERPLYEAYAPWVAGGAALALIGGVAAIVLTRARREWSVVVLAMSAFISGQVLMLGHEPLGRYKAGLDHVAKMSAELTPDTPIFAVNIYEQSIPFYLRRTLTLVAYADEMQFGVDQEPQLWIPKRENFVRRWEEMRAAGKKALAIIHPDAFAELQKEGVPMRVISRDPRRVIVANDIKQ